MRHQGDESAFKRHRGLLQTFAERLSSDIDLEESTNCKGDLATYKFQSPLFLCCIRPHTWINCSHMFRFFQFKLDHAFVRERIANMDRCWKAAGEQSKRKWENHVNVENPYTCLCGPLCVHTSMVSSRHTYACSCTDRQGGCVSPASPANQPTLHTPQA